MSKFIFGVCCGVVIVCGFIHIMYLKKKENEEPES